MYTKQSILKEITVNLINNVTGKTIVQQNTQTVAKKCANQTKKYK